MPAAVSKVANLVQRLATQPIIEPDAALLARFVKSRDEAAFATLVERHGPLVRGVCRRTLGNVAAVDDIVQATFIALANKAGAIRRADSLSAWLYGTAHRLTRNHRLREIGRRSREQRAAKPEARAPEQAWQDLHAILDEEIQRLPESLRGPILLCYFDGRTQDEAARQTGLSVPTLRRRLEKGRSLLKLRLERRGIAPALALTALAVSRETISAATARQIAALALSARINSHIAAGVTNVFCGGIRGWAWAVTAVIVGAGIFATGAGPQQTPASPTPPAPAQKQVANMPALDHEGEPLPEGALARVGSTRLRHGGFITSIAVSPDGATIASVGFGGLALWNAATGKLKCRVKLADGRYPVSAVTILEDGTVVVVDKHAFYRIEPKANAEPIVHTLLIERGPNAISAAAISSDGRLFAVGRYDLSVEVYDAVHGSVIWKEKNDGSSIRGLAFSTDNKRLAVASCARLVRVFEADSGKSILELAGDQSQVVAVAFSPDGKLLATQSGGKEPEAQTLVIWDIATKKARIKVDNLESWTLSLAFSPDGKQIATRGIDFEVKLIDVQDGKIVRSISRLSAARTWAFSPQGEFLACGCNGVIALWNLRTGKLASPPDPVGGVWGVRFSADGENLILDAEDEYSVRNWRNNGPTTRLAPTGVHLYTTSLSPDCKSIAAVPRKGVIQAIDAETGKERFRFDTNGEYCQASMFSPDNNRLFAGNENVTYVIDVATGQLRWKFNTRLTWRYQAAISADSRWFAAPTVKKIASGEQIVLYDLTTGKEVRRFIPKWQEAIALAFSQDGTRLAAVGYQGGPPDSTGAVTIWDRETGNEVRSFLGHGEGRLLGVAFSPDGRMLATGGDDHTLRIWEVQTGIERRLIDAHSNSVYSVAFSPDGRRLASASIDAPVYVWDVYAVPGAATKRSADELWDVLRTSAEHLSAIGYMIANPDQAIQLCRDKIKPSAKPDEKRVRRLINDLADSAYAVRENAEKELARLGDSVETTLRRELEATPSAEKSSRLKKLLSALVTPPPERMAAFRAMEAIERIGTPQARKLIEEWAGGDPDNSFTRAAGKSLERMNARWRPP